MKLRNSPRHPATKMICCPKSGATAGTITKNTKMSDETRACSAPENRSRVTACEIVRVDAAPKPIANRIAMSMSSDVANAAAPAAST